MSAESRARLCPKHRNDRIPTSSCAACAQARRIAELEQTVEQLSAHIEELESNEQADEEKTRQIAIPESESP
jgi:cell division protein FtsB